MQYLKPNPDWEEHEKPFLPGSPSMPYHRPAIRLAYALVAILVGITGGLGNALVSASLPSIQGHLGLTPSEAAWLPASYVMVNVTANLLIYKFRQQYGMRLFTEIGLGLYALLALLHLAVGSLETALLVRAASGIAAAAATTCAMLYMLQAAPRAYTLKMLVLGVGISQLAVPIAWIISPGLLEGGEWHNLYLFEAGLALCSFAAVVSLKLPPGIHIKVIEPLDFLTFALMAPAVALLVAVLAQGYTHWWLDTPWLGYMLIGSIVLMTLSFTIEHHRKNPLIQTRFLLTGSTIRFIIGAFLIRFLTSEQSVGAVGMLRALGMGPDQL
jgi:MFS family permease